MTRDGTALSEADWLLRAAVFECDREAVERLLPSASNLSQIGAHERDTTGRSLLHTAVDKESAPIVSLLLAAGADPNARDSFGSTPLMHAVYRSCPECAQALALASDLALEHRGGDTALAMARALAEHAPGPRSARCLEILVQAPHLLAALAEASELRSQLGPNAMGADASARGRGPRV